MKNTSLTEYYSEIAFYGNAKTISIRNGKNKKMVSFFSIGRGFSFSF